MDLTALTNLQTVGTDAFSSIVGLKTVKLSDDQAKTINPGVFSGADSAGGDSQNWSITITGGNFTDFSPATWPSTVVTVANNLNRLKDVTTIDLSQATTTAGQTISTLQGGVLWGNESIQTLKLPATATQWKLTDVNSYESAPIGYSSEKSNSGLVGSSSQGIEFSGFTVGQGQGFNALNDQTWSQVAAILNMFGRVESSQGDSNKDKNLLPWKDSFQDPELTASSVKLGWKKTKSDSTEELTSSVGTWTLTVNGVLWTYKNDSGNITLTASTANLYRAGYTGNQYAFYQVGFGSKDGKIDHTKTVGVLLGELTLLRFACNLK